MSWTRLDDLWTDSAVLADLDYEARWHYLALIQFCSRTDAHDGIVRAADARRCSDVPDPARVLVALAAVGLIEHTPDGRVKVPRIADHIPPPHIRKNAEQTKIRMSRLRAHKAGDHSKCLPGNCPEAPVTGSVTAEVTRNTGTGRDRTGLLTEAPTSERSLSSVPALPAEGSICPNCHWPVYPGCEREHTDGCPKYINRGEPPAA